MQRILYMIRKEFRQIFRDPPMVAIIFMVPLFQLLILANAITTEVKHIKLTIVDYDNSLQSREIVRAFSKTDRFDVIEHKTDLSSVYQDMQAWKTQMALVIPPDFSKDLQRHLNPKIQIQIDGVDGNTAGVALSYAKNILNQFALDFSLNPQHSALIKGVHLLTMEERMWYNLDMNSKQYMVPGIIVILLTILPMMLSSMSLVKEKEIGTLEQLMVTPLKKHQLLLGKIIPFLVLSYIELALVTAFALVIFNIQMIGSFFLVALLGFLYLFTTIGFGIFISTFTDSQQQAMFVSWFFIVFMILMSGFFIPIANMPPILQKLTYLDPMRYFMSIVRDIFQKGSTLKHLWVDVLPMTAFGFIVFTLGVMKFRKRIG